MDESSVLIFFRESSNGLKISGIDGRIFQDSFESVNQDSFEGVFVLFEELLETKVVDLFFITFLGKNVVKLHRGAQGNQC